MTAQMQIPFFNYPALFREREQEYMSAIQNVLSRGAYIMQSDLFDFEAGLANYLGVKHAIGLADGTMALMMAVKAAGIGPGDEVIVPSHTFVASAAAIHHAGATPVLADCGRDHLIDPTSIERLVTPRTKGIMPVQLNGRTAEMDQIGAIAARHKLAIVEDSCQALGSKFKGRFAGTFGVAGTFSFYPSKTLGCFGDGGALITDDDDVVDRIRLMRDHGRGASGKVETWGFNARLDNLQAAILNLKLKTYDADIAYRRALAARYDELLRDVAELVLPPPPDADPDHFDIFQNYEVEAERRDDLRAFLAGHGVQTIVQWGGHTIHQFEKLGLRADCAYTESMTARYLLLPLNRALRLDEVDYVCGVIRAFYGYAA